MSFRLIVRSLVLLVVLLVPGLPPAHGAIVSPEICDNCFDDDANGKTDRLDNPVCQEPADGGEAGLPDESDAKGAVKCQKGIEKASLGFAAKKLGRLSKCVNAAFACVQLHNGDSTCIDKATTACTKQLAGIPGDEQKAKAAIEKVCDDSQGASVSIADIKLVTGLGFVAEQNLQNCPATITSASDLADCVIDRHECGVERLLVAASPRAKEMLDQLSQNVAVNFPCVQDADATKGTDGAGANLTDATQEKAAVKCQATLLKAGVKLGKLGGKTVQKCADGAAACIQLKNGDLGCQSKIATKCQATFAKLNSATGPFAKLVLATDHKCGAALDLAQLNDPAGLGFAAVTDPNARCSQFALDPFGPIGQLVECVGKQYLCEGAQVLEREAPRLREYAAFLGIPIGAFGF